MPLKYEDGSDVEQEKLSQIKDELLEKFGGFSIHPLHVEGGWTDPDTQLKYYDNSKRLEVSIPNTKENIEFLAAYKEKLKQFLRQREIYIVYMEIVQV